MVSQELILWGVDTQADFMLPGGKLYVPGAEKLLPNIRRLTDAAREDRVFLVTHGCYHEPDDPEFQVFPPHCLKGTPGSDFVEHATTNRLVRVMNDSTAGIPGNLLEYQQVLLEKQTLDIFQSQHAGSLVARLPREAEFVVFGVVTEYCVRFAAKGLLARGRSVSVVQDAIETLNTVEGRQTIAELQALGAKLTTTDQALGRLVNSV
jgi:nicotinamidase/pyrazinamidase